MRLFLDGATIFSPGAPLRSGALIDAGRFIAFGPEAAELFNPTVDARLALAGSFIAPAFGDGHAHPLFAGREAGGPAITGLGSIQEIQEELLRYSKENPRGWIVGGAYEAALIDGGDFDAKWIDQVVGDRPVLLHAVDHHTIWVNTKALEIAGITAQTIDPEGGSIARRSDGSPKGTLREPAAINLVLSKITPRTVDQEVEALAYASRKYLESGVTFATDSWLEEGMAEIYLEAYKRGVLQIDMNVAFLVNPDHWHEDSKRIIKERALFEGIKEINASSVKFLSDGALSSGTAALIDEYDDQPGYSGIKIWGDEELNYALQHFDLLKFQVHIHAIGDAAVRQALNAIETMQGKNPAWDRRPVIVHAQLISEIDLPRFAKLGVIANLQPLWMHLDPMNKELIAPRIGARNNLQYRVRDMVEAGATIAFGSDWPVTSENPLLALAVPVHRSKPGSKEPAWSLDQAIGLEQSWAFYTTAVAYQNFREADLGRCEIGAMADFIILSQNPFELSPREVHTIKIEAIYKAGEKIN